MIKWLSHVSLNNLHSIQSQAIAGLQILIPMPLNYKSSNTIQSNFITTVVIDIVRAYVILVTDLE